MIQSLQKDIKLRKEGELVAEKKVRTNTSMQTGPHAWSLRSTT